MSDPSIALTWAAAAGGVALVMAATAGMTRRAGKAAYVDAAWGASFVAAAWAATTFVLATGSTPSWRGWVLDALVTVWGLRLTWHLARRVSSSEHDDPRYEDYLGGSVADVPFVRVLMKVFGLQGLLVAIVALPLAVGVSRPASALWVVVIGAALWLVGLVFEAVSDAQLSAYRADPHRPPLLTTGLWAWSRHPNYFGDFCVWWGLWLVAAPGTAIGWISVLSPVVMSWILIRVSGVRLAEQRMAGRPGWTEYRSRTAIFVPRPPRRRIPSRRGMRAEQ